MSLLISCNIFYTVREKIIMITLGYRTQTDLEAPTMRVDHEPTTSARARKLCSVSYLLILVISSTKTIDKNYFLSIILYSTGVDASLL